MHTRLARRVEALAALPTRFNHALFERYTDACATRSAHLDHALDLADGSFNAPSQDSLTVDDEARCDA